MPMTSVDGYIHTARAMGQWKPVTNRLSEISVPTLIVWGDEDSLFREPSRILQEKVPNADLITVKGSGHSPHEESPTFFNNALLAFVDRIDC